MAHKHQLGRPSPIKHIAPGDIRPIKFGNRLLWPVAEIAALMHGGVKRVVQDQIQHS